ASSPNSDRLIGVNSLAYGGTITVQNLGAALQNGDSFTLFSASSYSGIPSVVLPPLTPPLIWDTSQLSVNGTIKVKVPGIVLTCSTNITVSATSGSGAVVN